MGLFDKIFGRSPRVTPGGFFRTLTAYQPVFTTWGGEMYESELVRAAIDARARHISKLMVTVCGGGSVSRSLNRAPNSWQTWSQFLYRLSTILDVQNTAFIVPVYDELGRVAGIFPVLPSRCELMDVDGEPWLRYTFQTGEKAAIPLASVAVMTRFQYQDDLFGSSNAALNDTLSMMDINRQGINEAVKNSAAFRFMARLTNFAKPEDLAKERKRFNRENLQDEGGLLLFPSTYSDIQKLESKPFTVDAEQLKLIKTNVCDYFGVNEAILQNAAYGDAWAAFYEGAVEPFAVQFAETLGKMLFTRRERAQGAGVRVASNRLQYMSNQDKLRVAAQMADRGLMTRNEIRDMFSLPMLPPEIGDQLPIRGEYYNLADRFKAPATPPPLGDAEGGQNGPPPAQEEPAPDDQP